MPGRRNPMLCHGTDLKRGFVWNCMLAFRAHLLWRSAWLPAESHAAAQQRYDSFCSGRK